MQRKLFNISLTHYVTSCVLLLLLTGINLPIYGQLGPVGTPQNGMVVYYPFDGTNAISSAREQVTQLNANRAAFPSAAVSFTARGVRGNALQIDGANLTGVGATANPAVNFLGRVNNTIADTNEYSVSFWFRPNTNPNLRDPSISLLSKRTNCTNPAAFGVFWDLRINTNPNNAPGTIRYGHEVFLNGNANNNNVGGNAADGNCWNHVVITRTVANGQATSRLFVNGTIAATGAIGLVQNIMDTAPLAISGSGCIANGNPDGTIDYNGLFDELMVYNRPLTEEEVLNLNTAYLISNCCPARNNPDYLQLRADVLNADELTELATYGIRPRTNIAGQATNLFVIGDGATHILPNKVFIGDDVTLEVRNGSTVDFTNADVVLGNCANININAGNAVAHNATFRPCDEFGSWRGIEIGNSFTNLPERIAFPDANPSLTFNECTFVNAREAFYTTTREKNSVIELNLTNNTFTNCHRALVVNRTSTTRPLTFRGGIASNTIHIDDQVNEINYCLVNPINYTGILANEAHFRQMLIGQNKFTNGTRTTSQVSFEGMNLTNTSLADIAGNHFTNNERAMVLISTNQLSIENNTFEVTRRSTADENNYQLTSQGPNGGSQAIQNLIKGNKFINSAEVNDATTNLSNNQNGSGAIYFTGTARYLSIEDNEIDGFEIGIFADAGSSTAAVIRNNHIKAFNFGILQRGITPRAIFNGQNIFTMHIACNQIDMYRPGTINNLDVEGIRIMGINAPNGNSGVGALTSNLLIEGNCISNTDRAVSIIAGFNQNSFSYVRMPTFRHNYMYNYRDAGLYVENITGSDMANNSFIGNNSSDDIRQVITAGNGGTLFSTRDDFGSGIAQVSGNVNAIPPTIASPSAASCGNQDLGDPSRNSALRCNDDIGIDNGGTSGVITQRVASPAMLTPDFKNAFDKVYTQDSSDALSLAITGIKYLESDRDVEDIYQAANEKSWTNNQKNWLNYHYHIRNEALVNANLALDNIIPADQNEMDLISISSLLLTKSKTSGDLSATDFAILDEIVKRNGSQAPFARNIIHVSKGSNPYSYPKVIISQAKNEDISKRVDISKNPILLYPNPVQDEVSILISGESKWEMATIYSMTGNFIEQKSIGANLIRFNTINLYPGLYFITLEDANGIKLTKKFIKK